MVGTSTFTPGGYRYIPAVFQYSGGVAAEPGFAIERVAFRAPVPLKEGFRRAAEIIKAAGRPLTAFCACELRSPAQFTEEGFRAFNRHYVGTLEAWGIFKSDVNPVARSNVCPEVAPPAEPCFHAFSFTLKASAAPTFVVAGSGEVPEGKGVYGDNIVARGDTSAAGLRRKALAVLTEMERRLGLLGFAWTDTTAVQAYTVHDLHPFLADAIVRRGAARNGLVWHYCRPPVLELEFEMDCRGVGVERVV
jgi:hypothetical protein